MDGPTRGALSVLGVLVLPAVAEIGTEIGEGAYEACEDHLPAWLKKRDRARSAFTFTGMVVTGVGTMVVPILAIEYFDRRAYARVANRS